ncbi:Rieske (2Fe-2S) protein [Pararoseomonas indoligenes]|uniref:Rieske 2Fe-2S domain-containing protein n=1 Tax=Roseomonas indoligenes TaxID=2820811 RepID=A0A940N5C0_9PROT|nr:Rieske 2Fe-2S domain-containing protein [Pararoseomonas indoligenes]MBP0495425.1 Rieske 2Fe-2S domain-containing protein [Pararoseomonas indoligenes]
MSAEIPLGRLEDFPEGTATPIVCERDGRSTALLVVHQGGRLVAYLHMCRHQYLPLTWRGRRVLSADGRRIRCSSHGAEFAVEHGRPLGGPGDGSGLTAVALHIEDGAVSLAG